MERGAPVLLLPCRLINKLHSHQEARYEPNQERRAQLIATGQSADGCHAGHGRSFQVSKGPISHLHLRTTGQAESVGLLCRQTALQCPPYCCKQEVEGGRKQLGFPFSAGETAQVLLASVHAKGSAGRHSRDFRLTRERLLSRGCVRWLGP